MTEIRLYVEGGGDKEGKARLRHAFGTFFGRLHDEARRNGVQWRVILCGSRNQTYEDFLLALRTHPNAVNLLLVDAERPVAALPRAHLQASPPEGDGWELGAVEDDQCHLMVEVMESWFLAEPRVLSALYGQGFVANALPKNQKIEKIAKAAVFEALQRATRGTQKGEYHKGRHAPQILERLNPDTVRSRAPHCARLWETIEGKLRGGG